MTAGLFTLTWRVISQSEHFLVENKIKKPTLTK